MKMYEEKDLIDFEFWSGAEDFAALLTQDEFRQIELVLEEMYLEGMEATEINDLFWFEREYLAECIGTTEEEIWSR